MVKGQSKQKRRNRSESPPVFRYVSDANNRDNSNSGNNEIVPTPLRLTPPIVPSHQKHIRSLSSSPNTTTTTQSTPATVATATTDTIKTVRGNHRRSVSFDACVNVPSISLPPPAIPISATINASIGNGEDNHELVMNVPDTNNKDDNTTQLNNDVVIANVSTTTTVTSPPSSPRVAVGIQNTPIKLPLDAMTTSIANEKVKHDNVDDKNNGHGGDNHNDRVPMIINELPNASEMEMREYAKFLRHLSLESSQASMKIQRKMYKLRIMHNIKIISDVICSFILVIFGALIQQTNSVSVNVTQSSQTTSALVLKAATNSNDDNVPVSNNMFGPIQRRMVYASIALNGFIACTTALMGQLGIMQKIQVGTESLMLLQQQLDRLVMADTNFDCNCKSNDIQQSKMSLLVSHAKWKDKVMQFDVSIVQPLSSAPPATTRYFGSGHAGLVNMSLGRPDIQPRLSDLLQAHSSHGHSFNDHMAWASSSLSPTTTSAVSTSLVMTPLPSHNIYRRVQPSRVPVVSH